MRFALYEPIVVIEQKWKFPARAFLLCEVNRRKTIDLPSATLSLAARVQRIHKSTAAARITCESGENVFVTRKLLPSVLLRLTSLETIQSRDNIELRSWVNVVKSFEKTEVNLSSKICCTRIMESCRISSMKTKITTTGNRRLSHHLAAWWLRSSCWVGFMKLWSGGRPSRSSHFWSSL